MQWASARARSRSLVCVCVHERCDRELEYLASECIEFELNPTGAVRPMVGTSYSTYIHDVVLAALRVILILTAQTGRVE